VLQRKVKRSVAWVIAMPLLAYGAVIFIVLWPLWLAVAFIAASVWALDEVFR
jgi:hypothetical protein